MGKSSFLLLFLIPLFFGSCQINKKAGEWVSIFDGKTLRGWKKTAENPGSLIVEDGAIKCSGPGAHLFYEGDFKNFEFETEVKTNEHSISGIFIHTEFQNEGWPKKGYEILVNNSYHGSDKNNELRKTGSLYNIRNLYYPVAKDNEWFKMRIKVIENWIQIFVNDVKVNEYIEPKDPWRIEGSAGSSLTR
jgi:hypothetical protein